MYLRIYRIAGEFVSNLPGLIQVLDASHANLAAIKLSPTVYTHCRHDESGPGASARSGEGNERSAANADGVGSASGQEAPMPTSLASAAAMAATSFFGLPTTLHEDEESAFSPPRFGLFNREIVMPKGNQKLIVRTQSVVALTEHQLLLVEVIDSSSTGSGVGEDGEDSNVEGDGENVAGGSKKSGKGTSGTSLRGSGRKGGTDIGATGSKGSSKGTGGIDGGNGGNFLSGFERPEAHLETDGGGVGVGVGSGNIESERKAHPEHYSIAELDDEAVRLLHYRCVTSSNLLSRMQRFDVTSCIMLCSCPKNIDVFVFVF
jgi:hypothetical protein